MNLRKCLILTVVLLAMRGEAAVTFNPASPTSQDQITAVIAVAAGCSDTITTSIIGSSIRTDIVRQSCFPVPIPFSVPESVQFGPLAAGTYTFEVYLQNVEEHTGDVLDSREAIVVAPAIGGLGLSILALSLAGGSNGRGAPLSTGGDD